MEEVGSSPEAALTDTSDSEILKNCERELMMMNSTMDFEEQMSARSEKRSREKSEDSSDESFCTVDRRRPKKLIRSTSNGNFSTSRFDVNKNNFQNSEEKTDTLTFEICLTSLQVLPKQMALAKWLRNGNIQNITRIKYKSPYKVFVQFDDRKQAEKLQNFPKNKELDIRAQFTDEVDLSYGVIKGVDLEMTDEEMLVSFSGAFEVVSVRRLRRLNEDGKWIDSESVRIGFKSQVVPQYVYAYGCRFRVEKYVFPVTQCSGCWKFGHSKKFCPIKKNLCPKCGKDHINCETQIFRCLNCNGPHMAINKTCPFFIKEKRIRILMSMKNITYKNALELYYIEKKECNKQVSPEQTEMSSLTFIDVNEKLSGEHKEQFTDGEPVILEHRKVDYATVVKNKSDKNSKEGSNKPKKKFTINVHDNINKSVLTENLENIQNHEEEKRDTNERKFQWRKIWRNIMAIVFSTEQNLMDKMKAVFKIICEEVKLLLISNFMDGDLLNFFTSKNNG